MVRVNYPPGGNLRLQGETLRQPQTVRILQPPGGSSSISFSDDSEVKNGARSPNQRATSSPSGNAQQPNFDSAASTSSEDSSNQNGVKGKISDEPDLCNVVENVTSNGSENPVKNLQPDNESKEFPLPKELEERSSNIIEKSVSEREVEEEVKVSESFSEKQSEVVSEVSVTEASHISVSEESSETSKVEVSSVTENKTQEVISDSESVVKESSNTINVNESEDISLKEESNGVAKNHDLPPLHIPKNDSSSATTTTPSPSVSSPPVRPNEDAKNRVIGEQAEKPAPQQAPPRKIKDHMRSNIFMSDEDYFPTRSSRMNATINDPKKDVPAAGQRQRIPPGGFSTKLW
ncbi:UNVERIFIED_CONTAM: hypothetical protein RMT77_004915 [Armadillidium vulgare]